MSAAATEDDWPSHTQELTRKMNEQSARFVGAHARGDLSDRELYLIMSCLWNTCSGLVIESDLRVIENVQAEVRLTMKAKQVRRR